MEKWKQALGSCRHYLVKNVDIKDSGLWDAVMSEGIISSIQADSIKCNNNSNFKQVSGFIDHLLKRPERDYRGFLKCLNETEQSHAAEYLEQAVSQQPSRGQQGGYGGASYNPAYGQPQSYGRTGTTAYASMDAQPHGTIPAAATGLEHLSMNVHVPAPKAEIVKLKSQLRSIDVKEKPPQITAEAYRTIHQRESCYPIKSQIRGRALVITMTGNRKGWGNDVLSLEMLFRYLNVLSEHKFDLGLKAMVADIEDFAASEENGDVDVLFVVLMAHGGKWNGQEFLKTADGKAFPVRQQLEKIFNNHAHPSLIDKPKVFIIQMCRGEDIERGVPVDNSTQTDVTVVRDRKVASFTDYIFGFATQPGRVAHRDIDTGTWYIQKLTEVFMKKSHHQSVTHLFSQINAILEEHAADKDGGAQVGESLSGLKHPLYLFPGYKPQSD